MLSRGLILAVLLGYGAWVVFPMVWVAYSSLKADARDFPRHVRAAVGRRAATRRTTRMPGARRSSAIIFSTACS